MTMKARAIIIKWKEKKGLTYQQLADGIGYAKDHVWNILAGNKPLTGSFLLSIQEFSGGELLAWDLWKKK